MDSMSLKEFTLPDLGEGLTESELVSWEVEVGDTVELNQILGEVETAKALVELPSPFAGTIAGLLVEPGTSVKVGTPIVTIETADAAAEEPADAAPAVAEPPAAPEPPAASAAQPERTSVLVGYGPRVGTDERPRRRERREGWIEGHEVADVPEPRGRREPQHPAAGSAGEDVRHPIGGVRRRMAEAMVQSAFTAPHASLHLTVDVTATLELKDRLRRDARLEGHHVGLLALIAKACLVAMRRTPAINSRWDEEHGEVIEFAHVNLGVAAATDRGLIVPNIREADRLSLSGLADALGDLTDAARTGSTTPAQLTGGTFTITNVGVFGVDAGTPILPPGEAAILALGAVRRQPWEHDGGIALRDVMTLTLSFDHRLIDGRQGSEFLADVGSILRDPGVVLTFV
jgi:2-oxoisovalerate dehydrogenase E2 component (dihydrolipoyl transacylase)